MSETEPLRGAFDYLLDPIRDQPPPPSSPERDGGGRPQRTRGGTEITERRPVKRDMGLTGAVISLIPLGLLAWGALS
jgi:hypothetical protein